jgi:acyl carrier protein
MTLHQKLEQLFEAVLNEPVVLTDDTAPVSLPGWDSVAHINLMFSLEQEFGIQFSGSELSDVQTVGELKQLLREKTTAGGSAHARA